MWYIKIASKEFNKIGLSIKSDNTMFKDDVVLKITGEFISFTRADMDYKGITNKLAKNKSSNWYQTSLKKDIKED
jgi:hypothetical protein